MHIAMRWSISNTRSNLVTGVIKSVHTHIGKVYNVKWVNSSLDFEGALFVVCINGYNLKDCKTANYL